MAAPGVRPTGSSRILDLPLARPSGMRPSRNSPPQTHMLATGTPLTQRNFSQGHWGPGGEAGRTSCGAGVEVHWEPSPSGEAWRHSGSTEMGGRVLGAQKWQPLSVTCSLRQKLMGHNNLRLPPAGLGSLPREGSRLQDWPLQSWLGTSHRGHGWPPFRCQGPKEAFLVVCPIPFGPALCPRPYLSLSGWPHAHLHDLCPPSQRCLLLMQLVGLVSSGQPGSRVGEHTVPCAGGYSPCP